MLDVTTEWGQHAEQRLRSDVIGWLTTVGPEGRPYTVPVWFLWKDGTVLIFSQPNKQKIRNLPNNPRVTLALDGTNGGGDVVIIEGTAELVNDPEISVEMPAYVEKYGTHIQDEGWATPAAMAADFSQAIRITPKKIRKW
ncbi:pyridoxamine 5'-phosphate oxidase [Reticulibacter mediterranei]|uniref:Pyridoxamine 5'-phosphate oxidase n=1 Tax=Reticulibacter mediterranei TaxID=2778369 RepID=A0A8J3IN58_9CHLR|nr:TIGR03667 family PPOX class F420-dependent oxidoreductase [Reticulibacter mediterranei]GHO95458.1 pyridoxamine 5'-phosphate oxidase [Reticulibacter mediterranei]